MGTIQLARQLLMGEHGQRLSQRIRFTRRCTGQFSNIRPRGNDILKIRAAALRVTDMYKKILAGLHDTNFLNVDVMSLVFHASD